MIPPRRYHFRYEPANLGGSLKRIASRIASFLAALVVTGSVFAQAYPSRPLRMVIPWPPGQATDLVGRVMAEKLSQIFGQPVVPDNKPGAGGMIGTDFAAKAPPDGYT